MSNTYQDRVVAEAEELGEKVVGLEMFFKTELFKSLERRDKDLLRNQAYVMGLYSEILHKRIMRF